MYLLQLLIDIYQVVIEIKAPFFLQIIIDKYMVVRE